MGSNIPLPALLSKPPEQPDPVGGIQKILALKSILGQQQMQNVELQTAQQGQRDQQATTQALREWDGQNPNDLPHLILQNGGSSNAVLNAQSKLIDMRQRAAALDETTLKNQQAQNDQYRGRILSVVNAPEDQKQSLWAAEVAKERQAGTQLPPNVTDQYPGDDVATEYGNSFALGSVLAKEAIDNKTATARQQQADASTKQANTAADRLSGEQNPASPLYKPTDDYLNARAAAGDPQAQAILKGRATQAGAVAGSEAAARQPYQKQLEQIRQDVGQQLSTDKDARDKIESSVLKPYEDKMSSIGALNSAVDQASKGNVAAARGVLLKLMGVTNPDGTKRYNEPEAARMLSMGSVPQRLAGSVKNLLTGDNWTPQMAADIKSFADAQGQVAQGNLTRGIGNVNRLYNTKVGSGLIPGGTGTPSFAQWKAGQGQ